MKRKRVSKEGQKVGERVTDGGRYDCDVRSSSETSLAQDKMFEGLGLQ